jgi:hypothetical protein
MSQEFNDYIASGVELVMFGCLDSSGNLAGGTAVAPAAGDVAGSPMLECKGVASADLSVPNPDTVTIPGSDVTQGQFIYAPEDPPAFDLETGVFMLGLQALAQKTKLLVRGGFTQGVLQPNTFLLQDMVWIFQSPAKKKDIGLAGLGAWSHMMLPVAQAYPRGRNGFTTRGAAADQYRVIGNPADKMCDGTPINRTLFGTDGAALVPGTNDYPFYYHRWTGDGVLDTFEALRLPIDDGDQVFITVNGVNTTAFTLSDYEITFTAPPALNAVIIAMIGFDPNAPLNPNA